MQLADDEVHVWRITTDRPCELAELWKTLAADEQAKADRFRFDRDRRRAIVRRAAMRQILATYVGCRAGELNFAYERQGKPALAEEFSDSAVQFNLSFSGELALCAVGRAPLGIDVEFERQVENAALVAKHFFTSAEIAWQDSADEPNRVFLHHWTRKEALIKATGSGLSVPLNSFDVSWPPSEQPREITVPDASGQPTTWWLCDLLPKPGCFAALATMRQVEMLEWRDWQA
jgi:4'-phosphopantetheinyl transferase